MANMTDRQIGYRDAQNGVYDKFYRYNRKDDGAAYDTGWQDAVSNGTAYQNNESLNII